MTPTVDYRLSDGIATITLKRPEHRNAVNLRMSEDMAPVLRRFEADGDARVAVLTGAGPVFCAGADLKASAAGEGPGVNGHALGGGLELVLASDLAVASQDARFGFPEATVGP